ncbi:MAG: aldo/keto reductase [Firmicutes bacterium]|nr:aldo/keto reductase [Bacillota bacterium]
MKQISLGNTAVSLPQVALGCMRISSLELPAAEQLIGTALECGVNFFDHADIYGGGESERLFARAAHLNADRREQVILQSKCAIHDGFYDFSRDYILKSVDGILQRLQTEYLDILLLHRPDTLMEPEEVAEAFDRLQSSGKVRWFGVSNHNPMQIALLNRACGGRVLIDQLQLSLTECGMIDAGLNVNMHKDDGINRDGSVLEYCRLNGITIQAWSPFQYGFFEGTFVGNNEKFPKLNEVLSRLAAEYGVTPTAIAAAWICRHPAGIQLIAGTTSPARLREICAGAGTELSRAEWYELYKAAGKTLP